MYECQKQRQLREKVVAWLWPETFHAIVAISLCFDSFAIKLIRYKGGTDDPDTLAIFSKPHRQPTLQKKKNNNNNNPNNVNALELVDVHRFATLLDVCSKK